MAEAAAVDIEAAQAVHGVHAVLDEAAVGRGIDAESRQRDDHLRGGLGRLAAEGGGEGAVVILHGAERIERLVHGGLYGVVRVIVGRERLDGHGGDIGIGRLAHHIPAAVGQLRAEDGVDELLARHVALRRIVVAVEGDERPNRAVDALIGDIAHLVETGQQVVAADIRDILADGRQREDHAGVVGRPVLVETLVGVAVLLHVLHDVLIVPVGHGAAGAGKADDHPLAADRADIGRAERLEQISGRLIGVLGVGRAGGSVLQLGEAGLRREEGVVVADLGLLAVGQGVIGRAGSGDHVAGGERHLADGVDGLLHAVDGDDVGIAGLGGGQGIGVRDLLLLRVGQRVIGAARGGDGVAGVGRNGADGIDLLDGVIDMPALELQRQRGELGENRSGTGTVLTIYTLGVGHTAVRRYAAEAADLDRAGQIVGQRAAILRNGNRNPLAHRVAVEVIHTAEARCCGLILVSIRILVIQDKAVVIHTGELLFRAEEVMELQIDCVPCLILGIRGKDVAVRVDEVIADLTRGDDLIGRGTVLLHADDVAAGGQARHGHGARLGIHRDAVGGEAAERQLIAHCGAGDAHGRAALGGEGVACTGVAEIEQDVMLGVDILLLVLRHFDAGTGNFHISLDSRAVIVHGDNEHTRALRPDGGEDLAVGAALALHMGHRVVGYENDGRTGLVGRQGRKTAVVGIGGDGDHIAGVAVEVDDLIVHVGQGDLAIHVVLDGLPVAEGVQLTRRAGLHVDVALTVDVQVDVRTVIHVLVEAIDGILGVLRITDMQILAGNRDCLLCIPLTKRPIRHTIRVLYPDKMVIIVQIRIAIRDNCQSKSYGNPICFVGSLRRLCELIVPVVAECTTADCGTRRSFHSNRCCSRNRRRNAQRVAVLRIGGRLGDGGGQIARRLVADRGQRGFDGFARHIQAGGIGRSIGIRGAQRALTLGTVGHDQLVGDGVVRILDPAAVGGIDLIDAAQRDLTAAHCHRDCKAAVAVAVGVIAVDPVVARGQLGGVLQLIAVGLGALALEEVLRALHAVGVGIDLDVAQLHAVQALELKRIGVALLIDVQGHGIRLARERAVARGKRQRHGARGIGGVGIAGRSGRGLRAVDADLIGQLVAVDIHKDLAEVERVAHTDLQRGLRRGVAADRGRTVRALLLDLEGVALRFAVIVVHAGPGGVAALDGDDRAVRDGNLRRAGILRAADARANLIVLVGRGGRDDDAAHVRGDGQGVLVRVLAKGLIQRTGAERDILDGLVGISPNAAEILTVIAGIHDANLVTGLQRTLRGGEGSEALVREPVVQCTHPAGHGAACAGLQAVDLGDVIALRAGLGIAPQRVDHAAHHGGIRFQIHPFVDQRPRPGGVCGRVGRVFHDHADLVGMICCECSRRQQAERQHQRHQQGNNPFLHTDESSFLV